MKKIEHHILPVSVYFKTYATLIILTTLTFLFAEIPKYYPALADKTLMHNLVAIGIAFTKVTLIILFFMGVKISTYLTKTFVILGFFWLMILAGILLDYATREWESVPGWSKTLPDALPRKPRPSEPWTE